ncbi:MAG: ribbon-helix-helix domain-containing protein, partial [Myxococcaceae bacterium]
SRQQFIHRERDMQEIHSTPVSSEADATTPGAQAKERDVVSTHVLVPEEQVEKLRELSRRTRIAQSEYLREAVDDLLTKYGKKPEEP